LIVWLAVNHRKPCWPETNSYCDARQRLTLGGIVELVHQTARKIEAGAKNQWLWKGRKVALVDGSTVSMPDTVKNQQAFPQANTQKAGVGFPLARLVAIISLATGVVRDLAMGPYKGKETGETALVRTLLDGLEPGEIVLGDRYFASYFMIAALIQRGVDCLFRMHQRRKFDFHRGRRLGSEDHVVTWTKPERPEWMDEATYAQMPNELEIRELRFKVNRPGFRVNELVLVTTMLDGAQYTKEDLASLFLERWNIELDLRSIKIEMQMDVLRCQTPDMVEKEIWMHALAYNLIRGVIAAAAQEHDKQPRHLSFKGALQAVESFREEMGGATLETRAQLINTTLKTIAANRVGDRPNRVEPRAIKRRPKPHRLLQEPRRQAKKRLLASNLR
jgi:putative transposase